MKIPGIQEVLKIKGEMQHMNFNALSQLDDFCELFHMRLVSVDDMSGTLSPEYAITMTCEDDSPIDDYGVYYYLVALSSGGELYVCEEDMFSGDTSKTPLIPISEFTDNLYNDLISDGWTYSDGVWS